jgi:type I restriction enzyme R subunit
MTTLTEADTCRKYVLPKLYAASWTDEQISEQKSFTDGRIVVAGAKPTRRPQKRADYLLKYRRDFTLAVVEAKSVYKNPGDGLQQAKDYAQILGLKFAYATNGHGIVEHDFTTGKDNDLETFPTPDELWGRLKAAENITPEISDRVLAPYYHLSGKTPRNYQEIAINRAVQAILQGKKRVLLTLATGTGKTVVAFQVCWKLWHSRWNRTGEFRPREFYISPTAISWWTTRRTKSSLLSAMPGTRSKARRSKAGRCTSPPTRPSPGTSAAPDSTANTPATFSTW